MINERNSFVFLYFLIFLLTSPTPHSLYSLLIKICIFKHCIITSRTRGDSWCYHPNLYLFVENFFLTPQKKQGYIALVWWEKIFKNFFRDRGGIVLLRVIIHHSYVSRLRKRPVVKEIKITDPQKLIQQMASWQEE